MTHREQKLPYNASCLLFKDLERCWEAVGITRPRAMCNLGRSREAVDSFRKQLTWNAPEKQSTRRTREVVNLGRVGYPGSRFKNVRQAMEALTSGRCKDEVHLEFGLTPGRCKYLRRVLGSRFKNLRRAPGSWFKDLRRVPGEPM